MIKGYGEKIENLYKNIRQTNLNELIKRRDYIKKIHPQILDIEKNIATIYLNMIKYIYKFTWKLLRQHLRL